jgi:hypothetical protein
VKWPRFNSLHASNFTDIDFPVLWDRFIHGLHIFISSLVDGWPEQKHLQQRSHCFELGKLLRNLCSYHCLLSKSHFKHLENFQSIFLQFKANIDADVLFSQVCLFLGMPALPVEQYVLVLNKTVHNSLAGTALFQAVNSSADSVASSSRSLY